MVETKYDRLMQWRDGQTPGPWKISLYPTYRCNIQCKICWKREFPEPLTAKEELPTERLVRLVDEAAEMGVREWIIGGGGELMLRSKAIMKMVRRIREHGMNGLIQTNMTRFSDENLHELVDLGWDSINVSLDGPTSEINDANRADNNFERSIETIERLQQFKREKNSQLPLVHLISVITNVNYRHLKGMVDLSERLGLSPGTLGAVDLIVYGEHDKKYLLSQDQRRELPGLVREAIHYAASKQVSCSYHTYLKAISDPEPPDALDLFSRPLDHVSADTMCFEPFLHLVVMPQGDSGPCCTFNSKDCNSIWEAPLRDVWYGPYMEQVRRDILGGAAPEYCRECMPTQIELNRELQTQFAEALLQETMSVGKFIRKAQRSLKSNGVIGSVRRGKEWIQVRTRPRAGSGSA